MLLYILTSLSLSLTITVFRINIAKIKEYEDDEESEMYESHTDLCKNPVLLAVFRFIGILILRRQGVSGHDHEFFCFFLGADDIPPIGYIHAPVINFNPNSLYPTSSTCALQLTLPTCSSEYKPFKHACDVAFTMHGGFGLS